MTWLTTISKVMDIKAVQWAMLGLIACLTILMIVTQIRYNGLKLTHALLETKYAKMDAAVAVQNKNIEEANKAVEQYKLNAEQAKQNELKISQVNKENKKKLKAFQFKPNSSCDDKVHQIFNQYSSMRHK